MIKCDECDNKAVWLYMPGTAQYCDNCVPRGCSCNVIDYDAIVLEESKDEFGRLYPCVEYCYDENLQECL